MAQLELSKRFAAALERARQKSTSKPETLSVNESIRPDLNSVLVLDPDTDNAIYAATITRMVNPHARVAMLTSKTMPDDLSLKKFIKDNRPSIIITELTLPKNSEAKDPIEVIQQSFPNKDYNPRIIIVTSQLNSVEKDAILDKHPNIALVVKPYPPSYLMREIDPNQNGASPNWLEDSVAAV